jgi:hypothetical protein
MKTIDKQIEQEILSIWQRWAELFSIVAMFLLFGFFVSHQLANTGFFTASFGAVEMFCLYGPTLFSLVAPMIRALTGRRNPGRPFDVATQLFLAMASLWLLIVFPFNFAHLADVLPAAIRFVLSWITNDIGKAILLLQVIVCLISAIVTMRKYLAVRRREPAHPSAV